MKSKPSYFSIRALTSGDSAWATRLRNSPSVFILSTNALALSIDMLCSFYPRLIGTAQLFPRYVFRQSYGCTMRKPPFSDGFSETVQKVVFIIEEIFRKQFRIGKPSWKGEGGIPPSQPRVWRCRRIHVWPLIQRYCPASTSGHNPFGT